MRLVLQPLTLGHLSLLAQHRSPALEPGAELTFPDLLFTAVICSRSHVQAQRLIRSRLRLTLFSYYIGWRCRSLQRDAEAGKLFDYLRDHQSAPPLRPPKGGGRALHAPLVWRLYEMLTSTYHMSGRQALDVPVITAQCLWVTRGDLEGKLDLAAGGSVGGMSIPDIVAHLHRRHREAS